MRFTTLLIALFAYVVTPSMCVLGLMKHECKTCQSETTDCHHEPTCNDDPCEVAKPGTIKSAYQHVADTAFQPALIPVVLTSFTPVLISRTLVSQSALTPDSADARPHCAYPSTSFPLLV